MKMLNGETIAQVKQFADDAAIKAEEYSGVLSTAKQFILDTFGQNGLYASYIVLAAVILFVVSKLAKLTFSTIKYLVIPSLALALVGSIFIPYSFAALLPVTVTVCSLFLLFKG